ncbi:MAG TPA: SURF1 family protein [Azospirillaceae bacterium]|nr:SURF1 family protein [Azospirillaceae bacterium]
MRSAFWPMLTTLVGVGLLLALGTWQMQRREAKLDLIERVERQMAAPAVPLPALLPDPAEWDYRRVVITGRFLHDHEMRLVVRTHNGQVGAEIVTPLLRPNGGVILVNRGWVPQDRIEPAARPDSQPRGMVTVEGVARRPAPPAWLTPANDPVRNQWLWIDRDAMAKAAGVAEVAPVVVEAAARPDTLPVGGLTRVAFANDHLQYALTWYGLAIGLVIIYVVYHRQRTAQAQEPA